MISLGQLSGILIIAGVIPYIYEIFYRGVKPERTTWLIWTGILAISFFAQKSAGAGDSLWLTFGDMLACGIVFGISIFRGVGGTNRLDLICFMVALIGVAAWQLGGNPLVAILGGILADLAASAPTIRKAYITPEEEGFTVYAISLLAAVIGLVAAQSTDFVVLIFPMYLILSNATIVMAKLVGHARQNSSPHQTS